MEIEISAYVGEEVNYDVSVKGDKVEDVVEAIRAVVDELKAKNYTTSSHTN